MHIFEMCFYTKLIKQLFDLNYGDFITPDLHLPLVMPASLLLGAGFFRDLSMKCTYKPVRISKFTSYFWIAHNVVLSSLFSIPGSNSCVLSGILFNDY
jgi:hypothetical protein